MKNENSDIEQSKSIQNLKSIFDFYKVGNLKSISVSEFEEEITSAIGVVDSNIEGYRAEELDKQRDLSIKFHWGHNHNFGTFKLEGLMKDRHLDLMSQFVNYYPITLNTFAGKRILDIGCWTGGTSLLLVALGGDVVALEEVKKYAKMVSFLAKSFGISDRLKVEPLSIYDCNIDKFQNKFDIVYFPGVIYHLSDPVLALRILFNSLVLGGEILVESAGIDHQEPYCKFEGNYIYHKNSGTSAELNRGGWNWFLPSPSALSRMLQEAGFGQIDTVWDSDRKRVYGYGKKIKETAICKAGLSVREIQ